MALLRRRFNTITTTSWISWVFTLTIVFSCALIAFAHPFIRSSWFSTFAILFAATCATLVFFLGLLTFTLRQLNQYIMQVCEEISQGIADDVNPMDMLVNSRHFLSQYIFFGIAVYIMRRHARDG